MEQVDIIFFPDWESVGKELALLTTEEHPDRQEIRT
jgi:hypothetical protein